MIDVECYVAEGIFRPKFVGSFFELMLPCGVKVRIDKEWENFGFPFCGCHDFCPFGLDLYSCNIGRLAYLVDESCINRLSLMDIFSVDGCFPFGFWVYWLRDVEFSRKRKRRR